jgi:hypothetical protein
MRLLPFALLPIAFVGGVMFQQVRNYTPYTKEECKVDVMMVQDQLRHERRAKDGCELIASQCLNDVSLAEYRLKLCIMR